MLVECLRHFVSIFISKLFGCDEDVPACECLNGRGLAFVGVCGDIEWQVVGEFFSKLCNYVCWNVAEFCCAKCGDLNDPGDAKSSYCECCVDVLIGKRSGCVGKSKVLRLDVLVGVKSRYLKKCAHRYFGSASDCSDRDPLALKILDRFDVAALCDEEVDGFGIKGNKSTEFLHRLSFECTLAFIGKEIEAVRKNYFSFTLTKESKVLCCSAG